MAYTPPLAEQRFVLKHIVDIDALAETERFAAVSQDVVDAVLDGIGQFATGVFAPLSRVGDTVGAKWTPEGVVMPDGFASAYREYVDGGWGTIGVAEAWGGAGPSFRDADGGTRNVG